MKSRKRNNIEENIKFRRNRRFRRFNESLNDEYLFEIDGFNMTVDDEFEDDGEIGREITYSTDRLGDIVLVEVWSLNDPVTVIDEFYTENLFYRTYDNFEQFRNDLEYKLHRYLINESLRHYNRRRINENFDNIVTIGIYGDDVPGFNSVKGIINYFKSKGIEVYDVEGDMDYGWEMKLKGPGRAIYHAVVPKFPGYKSDSVLEFIDEYEIDS